MMDALHMLNNVQDGRGPQFPRYVHSIWHLRSRKSFSKRGTPDWIPGYLANCSAELAHVPSEPVGQHQPQRVISTPRCFLFGRDASKNAKVWEMHFTNMEATERVDICS